MSSPCAPSVSSRGSRAAPPPPSSAGRWRSEGVALLHRAAGEGDRPAKPVGGGGARPPLPTAGLLGQEGGEGVGVVGVPARQGRAVEREVLHRPGHAGVV